MSHVYIAQHHTVHHSHIIEVMSNVDTAMDFAHSHIHNLMTPYKGIVYCVRRYEHVDIYNKLNNGSHTRVFHEEIIDEDSIALEWVTVDMWEIIAYNINN